MYEVGSLLDVDYEAAGVLVGKSAMTHKHAEQGVFAGLPIGAGEVVGYFYRRLVYSGLSRQKKLTRMDGEGMVAVTVEQVSK